MNPARAIDSKRHSGPVRFDALAACDGTGLVVHNASALVEFDGMSARIIALDRWHEIDAHPAAKQAHRVRLHNSVLVPGFVNAHTHLDLTHIGPQSHDQAGFVGWVDMIRAKRHSDSAQIADSVRLGIENSLAAGTVAVGDIAGAPGGTPNLTPYRTLAASPLWGVSFLEFFGIGTTRKRARERVETALKQADPPTSRVKLGLQPHAPNTVDMRNYRWVAEMADRTGIPLSTHLAETPEERQFIAEGKGPQRAFLERMGIWDDSILDEVGMGRTPVRHLQDALSAARFAAAHVNDADDVALTILAKTQTSVLYCPRASEYFGADRHFGPHRYQEMMSAGINVALGTDSIVNLPSDSGCATLLSILDEARHLYRRDHADPVQLLRMATLNGAAALGLPASAFRFTPGEVLAGLVAIEVDPSKGEAANPFGLCLDSLHGAVLL